MSTLRTAATASSTRIDQVLPVTPIVTPIQKYIPIDKLVNLVIKSLPRLITFFLGMSYRLISFLTAYKALLAGLSAGVYFCTGVTIGVIGRT